MKHLIEQQLPNRRLWLVNAVMDWIQQKYESFICSVYSLADHSSRPFTPQSGLRYVKKTTDANGKKRKRSQEESCYDLKKARVPILRRKQPARASKSANAVFDGSSGEESRSE